VRKITYTFYVKRLKLAFLIEKSVKVDFLGNHYQDIKKDFHVMGRCLKFSKICQKKSFSLLVRWKRETSKVFLQSFHLPLLLGAMIFFFQDK